ncbi:serine/threonine-protein kinase/endoribonuclease IRE1 [Coccinella septempunctata]|uniref:serine/threonine-protein kinase/endoribonuclease IRE1 n=1 Tax=Coccinella septempunctata TaxID=41139 RepID=UPI001D082489|nr:serine/threonine-protein kinase/endoribonuclease IRE1 [Coccinella septempunctata]
MRVCFIIFVIFVKLNFSLENDIKTEQKSDKTTAVAPENDDRLLLFATLDGSLVNVDRITGYIKWDVKDRPIVEVPLNPDDVSVPIFLPDPRDGSLYLLDNSREPLKKLPFTIPQLVASSPCRSSDGILYTGKKKDAWFKLDPSTGMKQQIIGWDTSSPTCPIETSLFVYVGRTKYNIAMIDSQNPDKKWNVTFFDYTSKPVGKEDMANFELVLFASSSTGKIIALDRRSGQFLWELELESPVVGIYLLDTDGLLTVPYTMLANHTIAYLSSEFSADHIFDQKSRMKLYPTLYIGQHKSGLYAIPSLVDQNVVTITASDAGKLLLSGPNGPEEPQPYPDVPIPGQNYHIPPEMFDDSTFTFQSIPGLANHISIYTGHYNVPKYGKMRFMLPGKTESIRLISDGSESKSKEKKRQETGISDDVNMDDDNDDEYCNVTKSGTTNWTFIRYITNYAEVYQAMNDLQRTLVTLAGVLTISTVYIILMVRYVIRHKNKTYVKYPENGILQIGKITVQLEECIGSGCDGTMVYKGEFEGRPVAVKRLMTKGPKQIELVEREVALLKESDDHPNVIRYFCTEQDIGFRYIALEMCQATISDYIEGSKDFLPITPLQILQQTTEGLAHLHSLGIVHRDLKPHNVLISMKDSSGNVKAMISDFGLCKKLQSGRSSFSASRIEGSEGWTAPEALKKEPQRMTSSVDIFSLGCLFYYVLSEGKHPFGDIVYRTANIATGKPCDLQSLKGRNWEVNTQLCLIKSMISKNPKERPNCSAILSHPMFWDTTKMLNFFQDVSDRVEISEFDEVVLRSLESGGMYVVFNDWGDHIDQDLVIDLRKFRTYYGRSVRDLLRAMRNKKHHFRELTEAARQILGEIPDSFTYYWIDKFPLLLIHTYLTMQCVSHENIFSGYYQGGHNYSLEEFREHAKSYCESNGIFVDETQPPVEPIHKSPKRKRTNSSNTRSYKNAGPLKSKSRKAAHKQDEPTTWVIQDM